MWWFCYGLLTGLGLMRLIIWAWEGTLLIHWYEWSLIGLTVLFFGLTIQHFFASLAEFEKKAAWMGLIFLGIPAVACAGLATWLVAF